MPCCGGTYHHVSASYKNKNEKKIKKIPLRSRVTASRVLGSCSRATRALGAATTTDGRGFGFFHSLPPRVRETVLLFIIVCAVISGRQTTSRLGAIRGPRATAFNAHTSAAVWTRASVVVIYAHTYGRRGGAVVCVWQRRMSVVGRVCRVPCVRGKRAMWAAIRGPVLMLFCFFILARGGGCCLRPTLLFGNARGVAVKTRAHTEKQTFVVSAVFRKLKQLSLGDTSREGGKFFCKTN